MSYYKIYKVSHLNTNSLALISASNMCKDNELIILNTNDKKKKIEMYRDKKPL